MPSFSRPKSTRVQHMLDWYYNDLATCSGFVAAGVGFDGRVGLFNNSIGSWLFVYDIQFLSFGASFEYYYAIQGALATQFATAIPVVCDAGKPFGITFTDTIPHVNPDPTQPFPIIVNIGAVGPIRGDGPLAIIKPGYSLVTQTQRDNNTTFRYLVIGP